MEGLLIMQTQQQRVAEAAEKQLEQLQRQTLQVALEAAEAGEVPTFGQVLAAADREVSKNAAKSGVGGGAAGPGRPKGVRNKLTNIRDAVIEAFETVGGAEYLVKLANGTQSDRAAFSGLVAKVLPTQINQTVDGGIRLELSWLGSRQIGTTTAQIAEERTQVLDLQQENDGSYRIKDQAAQSAGGEGQAAPTAQKAAGDAQGEGQ